MEKKDVLDFFKNKKVQWAIVGILFLIILVTSVNIRTSNMHLLKDSTTGEYIPLALDPFYFLRMSERMVSGEDLSGLDMVRYPSVPRGFSDELTPHAVVGMYKIWNVFGDYSLYYVNVISPVVFFGMALLVFFILVYVLTKSKFVSTLSTAFLAFVPAFLYRTMAGFSDHEAIGMLAFFIALLVFVLGLNYLEKKRKIWCVILWGIGAGIASALTIASWGGIAVYLSIIFPLSFFGVWLVKFRESRKGSLNYLIFFVSWVLSMIFGGILFGFDASYIINRYTLASTSLLVPFILVFIILDYFLRDYQFGFVKKKYAIGCSLIRTIVIGLIGLFIIGQNPFSKIWSVLQQLVIPFGTGRVGLTVAENAQPYLVDWISQTGPVLFWLFMGGMFMLGFALFRNVKKLKSKWILTALWILMVFGIVFSRVSASSVMNGTSFLSVVFYFVPLIAFIVFLVKYYLNGELEIPTNLIFIAAWAFTVLVTGRSAIRLFFAITPFVCFSAGNFLISAWRKFKESKEEVIKILLIAILILGGIAAAYSLNLSYTGIKNSAPRTGPSANDQWQRAMGFVRDETPEDSLFVHWWDYGYWVQTLGDRATVTDGGHLWGHWDHFIGRYVLTTPEPNSALSFMKSHDVDYLLIDQTDLGKYSAYSRIGSDENYDRFSVIQTSPFYAPQTKETSEGFRRLYPFGVYESKDPECKTKGNVDEDIEYDLNGTKIFLPGPSYNEIGDACYKSTLELIMVETDKSEKGVKQPLAQYEYNGQRYTLPIRYVYVQGKLVDFGSGVDAVVSVIPSVSFEGQGANVEKFGAVIYLSPRVQKSLFARLYLLDNAFGDYDSFRLVHDQSDQVVSFLNMQGASLPEKIYYGGFRGPISVWDVDYPSDVLAHEEFLETQGGYAELDNLNFRL